MCRLPRFLILVAGLVACGPAAGQERREAEGVAFFEKKIRPVLVAECYACHSAEKTPKVRGGLSLDSRDGVRKGGESGPAIVPGKPEASLLVKAIGRADPALAMPPKKRLDPAVVREFEEWVRMGAPDPREGAAAAGKAIDIERGRTHWAYQPPKPSAAPTVTDADWSRTDIDRFVLAALEAKGLRPVADADRRTLLRRVTFDLTGLPPTPEEADAFAADPSPDAFETVVDRLLASRRFGETWARHWLDVARYAESSGKTVNFNYPHAWRYRDYVINAFNADKPYDEFVKEQVAGDLMRSDDPKVRAERLVATGFLAVGPKVLNDRNGLKFELDVADEQIDVTSQAFLGVTAACARCHDHKFDPIPQADYYALAGIFRSTETCYGTVRFINAQRQAPLLPLPPEANPAAALPVLTDAERKRIEGQIKAVRDSTRNMKDGVQQFFATGQLSLLQARLDAYDADGNPKPLAMGVRDKPARPEAGPPKIGFAGFTYDGTRAVADSPVYNRGESDQPTGAPVPRGTLRVLTRTPLQVPPAGSGRLELAGWVASPDNPLTARVMANRVWLHLFGRGLVPTPDDFGLAGRPPTHPDLLDHLARRFVDDGWSVKKLVRYLVTSRVYRLGPAADRGALAVDPDNTLYWRMAPRRLSAEAFRDALLAVSGQLEEAPPAGSAVARAGEGPVSQPRTGGDAVGAAVNDPRDAHRSIYLPIVRDNLPEALALFDAADPALIVSDRPRTTVPAQGLYLMNSPFVLRAADAAAARLLRDGGPEADRVRAAFVRCYGRPPTDGELAGAGAFLKAYRARITKDGVPTSRQERESWSAFCQALFTSAEFQYRR